VNKGVERITLRSSMSVAASCAATRQPRYTVWPTHIQRPECAEPALRLKPSLAAVGGGGHTFA